MGISLKAMVEALDEIRLGLVRTNEGKPRLAVEQMDRLPARLFSRFQLGDFVSKRAARKVRGYVDGAKVPFGTRRLGSGELTVPSTRSQRGGTLPRRRIS